MSTEQPDYRILTLGELQDALRGYPRDTEIDFGSTTDARKLIFYRFKDRGQHPGGGPKILQIELNEYPYR